MNKHDFGSQVRSQEREVHRVDDGKVQYLLRDEEQLLLLISTRAPLRRMLDEICSALDCQVGNVVSLISVPGEDPAELAANAALFGLHAFCSERVVAGNGELLGSLEMYSCESRSPTCREFQCIERARCLASIAIKRHNEAAQQSNGSMRDGLPARSHVIVWPETIH